MLKFQDEIQVENGFKYHMPDMQDGRLDPILVDNLLYKSLRTGNLALLAPRIVYQGVKPQNPAPDLAPILHQLAPTCT